MNMKNVNINHSSNRENVAIKTMRYDHSLCMLIVDREVRAHLFRMLIMRYVHVLKRTNTCWPRTLRWIEKTWGERTTLFYRPSENDPKFDGSFINSGIPICSVVGGLLFVIPTAREFYFLKVLLETWLRNRITGMSDERGWGFLHPFSDSFYEYQYANL